ncbi:hypothetical protein [Streptococcus sp. X13SY08]|nr:hypothetical protein [Streptococcus sp. X13SY08]
MATLSELLGKELSVNQVVQDLKETLSQLGARLKNYEVTSLDQERYYEYLDKK